MTFSLTMLLLLLLLWVILISATTTTNHLTSKLIQVVSPEECGKRLCPNLPALCGSNAAYCSVKPFCPNGNTKCSCLINVKCEEKDDKTVFHIEYDVEGRQGELVKVDVSMRVQGELIMLDSKPLYCTK